MRIPISEIIEKSSDFDSVIQQIKDCKGNCDVVLTLPFNKTPIYYEEKWIYLGFNELLLMDVYLLSNTYPNADFKVVIENCNPQKSKREYFSIEIYTRVQRKLNTRVEIWYQEGYSAELALVKDFVNKKTRKPPPVGRLMPLLHIDAQVLEALRSTPAATPVPIASVYKEISQRILKPEKTSPRHIREVLNRFRGELFDTEEMKKHLTDIPLLAQLIFYYFDHTYRKEAVMKLAEHLRAIIGKYSLDQTYCEDGFFLESEQWKLDKNMNDALEKACIEGYENQTLFQFIKNESNISQEDVRKNPHAFVLSSLTEASVIAEGVLQLLENIVEHGGITPGTGKGMLSIHLRHKETDAALLEKTYGKYFSPEAQRKERFFFEIVVSDLSDINISRSFCKKYESDYPELKDIKLEDFFAPLQKFKDFWDRFYGEGKGKSNAILHFGLEIFCSVVVSKGGLFVCTSGNEIYPYPDPQNEEMLEQAQAVAGGEVLDGTKKFGTTYHILLPMTSKEAPHPKGNEAIYSYGLTEFAGGKYTPINPFISPSIPDLSLKKVEYINKLREILDTVEASKNQFPFIEIGCRPRLEEHIKAALWHLYTKANESEEPTQRLAIINFTDFQFLEAIRIVALYFNKHGKNINMKNVSLFLKGSTIGLELDIIGSDLKAIQNTMLRTALLNGVNAQYIDAIQRLLTRGR